MPIKPATEPSIAEAAQALRDGRLVAFPTETVYGLGADATNGRAVARIFVVKGRPRFNPLIVHVLDIEAARAVGQFNATAESLAAAFWPGPLTLVLPRQWSAGISDLATAGLDTIAVRVVEHPVARALLQAFGGPVAAPSANRSGHVSPTTAHHVAADLGAAPVLILDGGSTAHGLESSIVDATGTTATILRLGAISRQQLAEALAAPVLANGAPPAHPSAPGQLLRHYAPRAQLRLNVCEPQPGEGLIAFGAAVPRHDGAMINLSPHGDLVEAAARLFSALREMDDLQQQRVAVMPIPNQGLGEAINDRLQRAAAGRR